MGSEHTWRRIFILYEMFEQIDAMWKVLNNNNKCFDKSLDQFHSSFWKEGRFPKMLSRFNFEANQILKAWGLFCGLLYFSQLLIISSLQRTVSFAIWLHLHFSRRTWNVLDSVLMSRRSTCLWTVWPLWHHCGWTTVLMSAILVVAIWIRVFSLY